MNTDDIKIGETYNLRVEILGKNEDFIHARPIAPNGEYTSTGFLEILHKYAPSFAPLPSEHGTSVPTPKHDPCRPFKEGDIVKPRFVDGRTDIDLSFLQPYTVTKREDAWGNVRVKNDCHSITTKAVFLELVSPVEELEPYKVNHVEELELFEVCHYEMGDDTIEKEGELHKIVRTIYWYGKRRLDRTKEEAKAAAEAERDRLNAEYRKEHLK